METRQTSNGSLAGSRSESLLEHHPQAANSTEPSQEEVTHHSVESSHSQDEGLRHQDDETSELMASQPQVQTRSALANEKQKPNPTGKVASRYAGWTIEITSIIISAAVLIGMAMFLLQLRGRLLTSWRIMIKPNTVLSILSTALKAATLLSVASSIGQLKWIYLSRKSLGPEQLEIYDDATRGPWGALVFFWKARKYGSFIAYIGSIVTIAAIALDPFSQEMLSFDPAPTKLDGVSSSVPRSQIYEIPQEVDPNEISSTLQIRDTLLQQAATNGLYSSTISTAPFTCPGSNCTYPTFTSLGIFGNCANVTAQTTHRCFDDSDIRSCNYTIPSGLRLTAQSKENVGESGHTLINSALGNSGFRYVNGVNDEPLLSAGIVTFASTNYGGYQNSWNDTMQAFQCDFGLVAYTYSNWTSTNGTINAESLAWSPLKPAVDRSGLLQVFNATSAKFPESENRTFAVNIYDLENLTETAQNIAMAMSFRILQGPNSTLVYGSVYEMQTYIHVHWWWLALGVTLLLLSCALLGTTITLSHKANLKAWKSSLDPLLYGVDEVGIVALSAKDSGVESIEHSQNAKKKTTVQQSC